jgi:hypothetical protein
MTWNRGNGNVGIGTTTPSHKLEVTGTAAKTTGTAWIAISDIRTKKNISPYERGLDTVL